MKQGYILSDEGFYNLTRLRTAMDTFNTILYETEGSNAIFKAEQFAATLSFYVDCLNEVLHEDLKFIQLTDH